MDEFVPHLHRRRDDDPCEAPPPPMTEDQLDFFTQQTRRAVDRALAKYQRMAALGFMILFIGFLYNAHNNSLQYDRLDDARSAVVDSGQAVAVDGCNRDYAEDVRIRDVFYNSRRLVIARLASGESPNPEADKLAVTFYNQQLHNFKLPDCRDSENVLTDNPDIPVPRVIPYHKDEPTAPVSTFTRSHGAKDGG